MKWLVLFLGAGIDSVGDLMTRLGPAGPTPAVVKRAKDLADQLRLQGLDYIITPPSHEDLAALRDS
jgi:hypothetical protein